MFGESERDRFVIPFARMKCIEEEGERCRAGRGSRSGEWGKGHERREDGWGETGVEVGTVDGRGNVET